MTSNQFVDAVTVVSRALSGKPSVASLEGIYLTADEQGTLRLEASDLSVTIHYTVTADVKEPGRILLQGRLLSEYLRRLPEFEDVDLSVRNNKAHIKCANSDFSLPGLSDTDFPQMPKPENDERTVSAPALREMLNKTLFAAAPDDQRQLLDGALFELVDDELHVVTLDGSRMAYMVAPAQGNAMRYTAKARALVEVSRLLPDEGDVRIALSLNHLHLYWDNIKTAVRLLSGEYVAFRTLIPEHYTTRAQVQTDLLRECIERVNLLARENINNKVVFKIEDGLLTITSSCKTGEAFEEMPVSLEGEPIDIAFNARLLLEILRQVTTRTVVMTMTNQTGACSILPGDKKEKWLYLIMPVVM